MASEKILFISEGKSLILMYLNGDEDSKTEALIYLKDLCTEKNKLLILLGNPADIKSVEESIPEPIISAVFERPVNTEALLERLAYLTDVNATQDRLRNVSSSMTTRRSSRRSRTGSRASTA